MSLRLTSCLHRWSILRQLQQLLRERSPSAIWRSLQWLLLGLVRKESSVATGQGIFTVSTRDTAIGRDLFVHGQFECALLQKAFGMMQKSGHLPDARTDVLIDVGANIGITCISAVKLGLAAKAIAIEPEPQNYARLVKNVNDNGLTAHITCIQAAVSDVGGQAFMELSPTNLGDHRLRSGDMVEGIFAEASRPVINVTTMTLDSIIDEQSQECSAGTLVLWIDVQGHEAKVLSGAAQTLTRGIPTVMEVWPYGMNRAGVTLEDLDGLLGAHWSQAADLEIPDARPVPMAHWKELYRRLARPGDYTNLLLLP